MHDHSSKFSRRALLKGAGAGLLSATGASALASYLGGGLFGNSAHAGPPASEDQYFIFCYYSGGWDLLLTLDPRDPAIFRPDLKKQTRIETGYERMPVGYQDLVPTAVDGMNFGPYIGKLADHATDLAVVRGMSMDTLTHEVGRRRFITGRPPAGLQAVGSSVSTVLAAQLGSQDPIPQLSVRVESYNAGFPSYSSAIRVNSVGDLVRALAKSPFDLPSGDQQAIDTLFARLAECPAPQASAMVSDALEFREAASSLTALGLDQRFDFSTNTPEMAALRDAYGIDQLNPRGAPAQAAAAVTALVEGISRSVSIEVASDLDAHGPDWGSSHGPRLKAGNDLVAAILSDLKRREYKGTGDTWFDHTTVVCFSEFGRSTLINTSGGRDHFLHNACVVAGGGIRGGRVLGASSDVGMYPQKVDMLTGALDPDGDIVYPEHVLRALMVRAGIEDDIADLGVEPYQALL